MLYHTTIITLNKSFITRYKCNGSSSQPPLHSISEAFKLCDASIEMVASILRRFGAHYTYQNAPLLLVHGAIVAADATLAMSSWPVTMFSNKDRMLPIFETALAELSSAWSIAGVAHDRLRTMMSQDWESPQDYDSLTKFGSVSSESAWTTSTSVSDDTVPSEFSMVHPSTSGFDFGSSVLNTATMMVSVDDQLSHLAGRGTDSGAMVPTDTNSEIEWWL